MEHLVPQSSIGFGFEESTVGQIGNLLLVDAETNGLLSTKDFNEKKAILARRGYVLPNLLIDAGELDMELIKRNTLRVSELARDVVWKV
ncbi:MAG: DUF1524 domain-containing protein [Pseudomonadota bacterium]